MDSSLIPEEDEILRALEETHIVVPPIEELIAIIHDPDRSLAEANTACHQLQWAVEAPGETQALDVLVTLVNDRTIPFERRRLAILPLVEKQEHRVAGFLTEIFLDKNRPVADRSSAVLSLAELKHVDAVPMLILALGDGTIGRNLQGSVAHALAAIGDRRATQSLLDLLERCHTKVRRAVIEALGEMRDSAAVPDLVKAMSDRSARSDHRRVAAFALGEIGDVRAVQVLLDALRSLDNDLRESAIEALGKLKAQAAGNTLMAIAKDPSEPEELRWSALRALMVIDSAAASSGAIVTDAYVDREIHYAALDTMMQTGTVERLQILLDALSSDNEGLREMALGHLRQFRLSEVVDAVVPLLRDDHEDVRRAAADTLGDIEDRRAIEPLRDIVYDRNVSRDTRCSAMIALAELGDASMIEPLLRELQMPPLHDRTDCQIVITLGNLGDPRAVETLIRLVSSSEIKGSNDACYYAISALGKLADKRAFEALVRLLIYNDRDVRCYTTEALGLLGDQRALPYLAWLMQYGMEWIFELGSIKDLAKEAIDRINANVTPSS